MISPKLLQDDASTAWAEASARSEIAPPARALAEDLWGQNPAGLHDRFWATRLVQVVRAGAGRQALSASDPELYLLLDHDAIAMFDMRAALRRMAWLKPRLMRLRLVEREETTYREHVTTEPDGRLRAIVREYGARSRRTARVSLTRDRRLAQQWAEGPGGLAGQRILAASVRSDRLASAVVPASLLGAPTTDAPRLLHELMKTWDSPHEATEGVYAYDHDVWAHETTWIEPGARIIGPVWLGAARRIRADAVIAGPIVIPDAPETIVRQRPIDWREVRALRWQTRRRKRRFRRVRGKRIFDVLFSAAVLVATAPLYPLIILAIIAEDGWPPFFAHTRQTRGGRDFPCIKFRTMCRNADAMKAELAVRNEADGPQFFIRDDPRLLRTGRLLRRLQLDELPQFINVFLGHMSVVGPRPSPDRENQRCPAWREARLRVRPGVTGLWQVRRTRAPETDFQEWIRYDLHYVQNRSWRLDLWIIKETIRKVLGG